MTNALNLKYRNTLAGLYAMLLIISGATARARKRVFKQGLFTSLCFHNPTHRLFESCIRWLKEKGYVFISSDELLEILEGRKEAPAGAVWSSLWGLQ